MPNPLNPDNLNSETLERIASFAGTILGDILESDKYEDILDDVAHADPSCPDIVEHPTEFYDFEAKISRQLWRTFAILLLDLHGPEQEI